MFSEFSKHTKKWIIPNYIFCFLSLTSQFWNLLRYFIRSNRPERKICSLAHEVASDRVEKCKIFLSKWHFNILCYVYTFIVFFIGKIKSQRNLDFDIKNSISFAFTHSWMGVKSAIGRSVGCLTVISQQSHELLFLFRLSSCSYLYLYWYNEMKRNENKT